LPKTTHMETVPLHGTRKPAAIKLLNWAGYFRPSLLAEFEAETGIHVHETRVSANEEFIRRVTAGERYDVINPTDWAAEALVNAGLVQPLDMESLPNWTHVARTRFAAPRYEAGGDKYTSVFCFGTEGFAARIDMLPAVRQSWEMLYDPDFSGQIAMLDGSREVLGPALFRLGASPNTTDQAVLDEATAMAMEQRPLVVGYGAQVAVEHIVQGTPLVECWDGNAMAAISRGVPQVRFVMPREGFRIWADAPCIPANAAEPAAAHLLLNYLLEPSVTAKNVDYTGYQPVAPAADPLIKSALQRSMRPTDERLARGTFLRDLGDFNTAFARAYARVRSVRAA
jgi:spermidine/putrescine transport system substrate-binding protein